jgi:hypothetical protein
MVKRSVPFLEPEVLLEEMASQKRVWKREVETEKDLLEMSSQKGVEQHFAVVVDPGRENVACVCEAWLL